MGSQPIQLAFQVITLECHCEAFQGDFRALECIRVLDLTTSGAGAKAPPLLHSFIRLLSPGLEDDL